MTMDTEPQITVHRQFIIEYLQGQDGKLEDSKGRCSDLISAGTGVSIGSITHILQEMEAHSIIRRRVQNKRTFMVELVGAWKTWSPPGDEEMMVDLSEDDSQERRIAIALLDEVLERRRDREDWVSPIDVEKRVKAVTASYDKIKAELRSAAESAQQRASAAQNRVIHVEKELAEAKEMIDVMQAEIDDQAHKLRLALNSRGGGDRLAAHNRAELDRIMKTKPKS